MSFSRYIPLSERSKRGIQNLLSGIECSRNDTDIEKCKGCEYADPGPGRKHCEIYDSLWLNCCDEEIYDWNPIPTDLGLYTERLRDKMNWNVEARDCCWLNLLVKGMNQILF